MIWNYEDGRIYSVDEKDELMAEVTFVLKEEGKANIDHTYVNPILRGKGVASDMMEVAVEYLKQKGLKASATCSYAKAWLEKQKDI